MIDGYLVGARVQRVKGYRYFGVVVATFATTKLERRYVVESLSHGSRGMLFIFNDSQLAPWVQPEDLAERFDD